MPFPPTAPAPFDWRRTAHLLGVPVLREQLGVWYTPEIVKCMVARVDTVLREESNVTGKLAGNLCLSIPALGSFERYSPIHVDSR